MGLGCSVEWERRGGGTDLGPTASILPAQGRRGLSIIRGMMSEGLLGCRETVGIHLLTALGSNHCKGHCSSVMTEHTGADVVQGLERSLVGVRPIMHVVTD